MSLGFAIGISKKKKFRLFAQNQDLELYTKIQDGVRSLAFKEEIGRKS